MEPDDHPLERQIPPIMHATPSDVRPGPDADSEIRWWKPGFHDVVEYVGWRWLLVVPALALIVLIVISWVTGWFVPFVFRSNAAFIAGEAKLAILAGGVAMSCLVYVTRRAVRARNEPFCIYCGYNLSHLPDDYRCPECGRPYTWKLIAEYRRDPHWFIERWKLHDQHQQESAALDAGAVPRRNPARDGTE